MALVSITGDKELDKKFRELADKLAKKVMAQAIRAGMRVIAKGIKSEIPGNMKEARKGIGMRFLRRDRRNSGEFLAKVGAGVGMKNAVRKAAAVAAATSHGKGKKPGVGISKQNIHWLLAGTGPRKKNATISATGKTLGKSTGVMPAISAVRTGFNKSDEAARQKIIATLRKGIAREAKK